jgi:uncharacterized protein YdaU (DUF1376 family)
MKKTYFNHDSNSRNDIRIIKLRSKLGYEGYGIFWSLLEVLFIEENKLSIKEYETLAYGLQCDPKKLKQVIENFDLFIIEKEYFYSKRLHKTISNINDKSNIASENAKKRWNSNATAMQPHTNRNASISKSKSNNTIKLNNNNKKGVDYYNNISFPDYYDIHYAKRIEKDVNMTKEYHKHLTDNCGYEQLINSYTGQTKWIKK